MYYIHVHAYYKQKNKKKSKISHLSYYGTFSKYVENTSVHN